jgi:hypothetical protein
MKVENNGKTLSGTTEEMKQEFYRQVKADEFQNGYWQWKFYSNFFNQFESLPNKNPPVFYENIKYACEMTEKHPEYAVLNRKPAKAGESRFVYFKSRFNWLAIVVATGAGKYQLIAPSSLNRITEDTYFSGQEIPNAYECTPEEIQQIKNSLFSS